MRVWIKVLTWLGVGIGLLGGLYLGLTSSIFHISGVQIDIAQDHREETLFNDIKKDMQPVVKGLVGHSIWSVSLDGLMKKVREDARISNMSIEKIYPAKLVLRISPRRPVALFIDEQERLFPLGADGEFLPGVSSASNYDLPILRGSVFLRQKSRRMEVVRMLVGLPLQGEFTTKNISEIHFLSKGEYALYLEEMDAIVKIQIVGFAYKASMVLRVLNYLKAHKLKGRVIDARFSKKVVVRLRNEI